MKDNHSPALPVTQHFTRRAATRGFPRDVARFVLQWGTEVRACDAVSLTVVERHLPPDVRGSALANRARDWVVVLSCEGTMLTCYRRRRATRFLQRKTDLEHGRSRRSRGRIGAGFPLEPGHAGRFGG